MIIAAPLVESIPFTDILSPSVEDQINFFVSNDTGNDNNNSLETLDVIDNAYKYVKHKKIKDILQPEIKKMIYATLGPQKIIYVFGVKCFKKIRVGR